MLKRGDSGPEVSHLQDRLRALGFDAAGHFGPLTEAAVAAFQRSRGLRPDGIAGPLTMRALAEAGPVPEEGFALANLHIDRTLRLAAGQIMAERHPKTLIVLHHTAGTTAHSTFHWWQNGDRRRVAAAYLVERNGTIHEVYDPHYWAYHLGLAGTSGQVDRRSIAIEIVSEGALIERDGRLYAFGRVHPKTEFTGTPYDCGQPWRGYRYFAPYTPEQVSAVCRLVDALCTTFGIPRQTPSDHFSYDPSLAECEGVIGHHHVRKDKTDLHPGFDWDRLTTSCNLVRLAQDSL